MTNIPQPKTIKLSRYDLKGLDLKDSYSLYDDGELTIYKKSLFSSVSNFKTFCKNVFINKKNITGSKGHYRTELI